MTTTPVFKSIAGKQALFEYSDQKLAQMPVPYETFMVNTRYGDTFVIEAGDPLNPPVILLHGVAANSVTWVLDIPTYSENYHVYAVDLIGEAGKSAPTRPPYEGKAYADWLDDVRTALNVDSVTLVGLSLGGWAALKYATTYPEHVTALVLLNPGGIVPNSYMFFLRMLFWVLFGKWGKKRAIQMLFGDFPIPDGVVEGMSLMMQHFNPRRETIPLYTDEELASLSMPVFVLGGEKDGVFKMKVALNRLQTHVPNIDARIVSGAGHAIINTAPDVLRFLMQMRELS